MALAITQILVCAVFAGLGAIFAADRRRGALTGGGIALASCVFATILLVIKLPNFLLYGERAPLAFYAKYAASVAALAVVIALIAMMVRGKLRVNITRPTNTWRTWVAVALVALVGLVVGGVLFSTIWVARNFGYITPDAIRFFLAGDTLADTTPEMYWSIINQVGVPTVLFALVAAVAGLAPWTTTIVRGEREHTLGLKGTRRILKSGVAIMMVGALAYATTLLPLLATIRTFVETSSYIEEHYVFPTEDNLTFPDKPKNLVHVFMESIENSYYSKEEGGYLEKSLMPELAELTREGVSFSHQEGMGGPHQINGATHSIAGMINMQTGVPMVPVALSNQWTISYADFPNLGAILADHGYNNSFMLGGDRNFHQLGDYFSTYGKFSIFDSSTAKQRGLVPEDYHVWWGIEDDKLYEYAKDELTRLSEQDAPFYFVLENADTHNNDGYLSPNIEEFPSDQQYGNVIHYSQAETVKLVRWMQQQSWYEDTVIVITGDHRSKDIHFFEGWDEDYERTIVNMILNGALPDPGPEITKNRDFAPFDYFPTIVAALGITIDGNQLGLGTNLYSGEPTLMERTGVHTIDREMTKRSPFYEERLIRDLNLKELK
ncbi:MAG: LTA synthase family protein [Bowdeniella nasicola]|nr:LTA synthase family protein [Bowdeniella nasicola]